jgi:hypothetical protein
LRLAAAVALAHSDKQLIKTSAAGTFIRRSCSRAGYFDDAFVQYFVRKPSRRSPLINRGVAWGLSHAHCRVHKHPQATKLSLLLPRCRLLLSVCGTAPVVKPLPGGDRCCRAPSTGA